MSPEKLTDLVALLRSLGVTRYKAAGIELELTPAYSLPFEASPSVSSAPIEDDVPPERVVKGVPPGPYANPALWGGNGPLGLE